MKLRTLVLLSLFTLSSKMVFPTLLTWTGIMNDANWSDGNNWGPMQVPVDGDSLEFLPGPTFITTNNDIVGLQIVDLTVDAPFNYILNGNDISLNYMGMGSTVSFNNTSLQGLQTININIALMNGVTIQQPGNHGQGVFNGAITGTGPVNSSGPSISLLGGNTYSGGTVIAANSNLYVTTSSLPATVGCTIGAGSNVIFGQTTNGSYGGLLSGPGNVIVQNTMSSSPTQITIMLTGVGNSYTGTTTVEAHTTLQIATANLPAAAPCVLNDTTAILNFNQATMDTFTGMISGTGEVFISGGGSLTLNNAMNSYSGGTTVSLATLIASTDSDMGALASPLNLGSLATDTPIFQAPNNISIGRPITINATTTEINPNGFHITHTGTNGGKATGTGSLQIGTMGGSGASILEIQVPYSYTGGTTLDSGTLLLTTSSALLPIGGNLTLAGPTTFDMSSAGVVAQNIGNLSGGGSTSLGGNTLAVTISSPQTYSGLISGTTASQLTKNGAANWSLSGDSINMLGTFTIAQGTVIANPGFGLPFAAFIVNGTFNPNGNNQTVGSLAGTGNVTLDMGEALTTGGNNSSTTWGGVISGTGSVTKTGTGTMTYTGTNTYTGGTTISTGTLAVTNQGFLPSTGPMTITSPGILDVSTAVNPQTIGTLSGSGTLNLGPQLFFHEATGSSVFSGTINGPSASIFDHIGSMPMTTLTLSGSSPSWSGELLITNGIVEAGAVNIFPNLNLVQLHAGGTFSLGANQIIGNFAGEGTLDLGTATLIVNSSRDATFSGNIVGSPGEIIYSGGHTLTLSGSSPIWPGTFEVAQGTVKVAAAGDLPLATFLVELPGTLRGVGTVGFIENFGTVHPGLSIGTLHVAGTYVESNTLGIEVNDLGASSAVDITGTLTINPGTTLRIEPILGKYNTTQTYTVATFASSTGHYSNFFATFPNRFTVSLIYDPTDIKVVVGLIPYASLIPSGNAGAAAACFDVIPGGPDSDAAIVTATLDALSNDLVALERAFEQLHPSQFSALPLVQENNNILVRSALTRKLNYGRPFDLPEVPNNLPQQEPSSEQTDQQELPPPVSPRARNGTVWLEGLGKYAHQSHEQHNHGYKAATGGFLLGSDYRFDKTYLGGALGYTDSHVAMNSSSGHGNIQSFYGALYGSWFTKMFFIDATAIGSRNYYDAVRPIKFPGLFRRAKNDHKGYQFGGSLGTGMLFYSHRYQLQPFARADYVFVHQQGYKEHGASSLNLHIHQADSRYVRTDLGLKVSRCWSYTKTKLLPYVKLSWIWEDQLDHGHVRSSFESSSCTFVVNGLHPVRSLIAPSLGITTFAYKDAFAFSFHYDAEIGSRFWENRAYLDFAYRY